MQLQLSGNFPIVCVGGSGGGLDAYVRLLLCLPKNLEAAIVIVDHAGMALAQLHEILPRCTDMDVKLITDGQRVLPNTIFIVPEKHDLHIWGGVFQLRPISRLHGWPDVITLCLQSLTRNWHGQLVAVIVSGYDADDAAALSCMRDAGGITIAQAPETSTAPGMPDPAYIDFVLTPEEIARKLASIARWCTHLEVATARYGASMKRDG